MTNDRFFRRTWRAPPFGEAHAQSFRRDRTALPDAAIDVTDPDASVVGSETTYRRSAGQPRREVRIERGRVVGMPGSAIANLAARAPNGVAVPAIDGMPTLFCSRISFGQCAVRSR